LTCKVFVQLMCSGHQRGVCLVGRPLAAVGHVLLTVHKPHAYQALLSGS
jgi:hypothetical protein